MRRRRITVLLSLVLISLALAAACGSTASNGGGSSGATPPPPPGDDTGDDAGAGADAAKTDGGKPTPDAGPTGWDGTFAGPLACTTPGAYKANSSGSCGTARWTIKIGSDSAASTVSLLPTLTMTSTLAALPQPGTLPFAARIKPVETTVYAFKDARLTFARLEDDSDYHLVLADKTGATLIGEIPYPKTCTPNSVWECFISRARAAVDAQLTLVLNQGRSQNLVVSVVGVGFWDDEHGQFGASPNGIELHPILAICFGAGCDPSK